MCLWQGGCSPPTSAQSFVCAAVWWWSRTSSTARWETAGKVQTDSFTAWQLTTVHECKIIHEQSYILFHMLGFVPLLWHGPYLSWYTSSYYCCISVSPTCIVLRWWITKYMNKNRAWCDVINVFMHRCTAGVHPDRRSVSNRCAKAFPWCPCAHRSLPVTPVPHHLLATTCHTETHWSQAQAVITTRHSHSHFLVSWRRVKNKPTPWSVPPTASVFKLSSSLLSWWIYFK